MHPVIGITMDMDEERAFVRPGYAAAVERAGGMPLLLPPRTARVTDYVELCDGIILTGGDDPIMEHWGIATHPKATKVHQQRQAFELALLEALKTVVDVPVLGICLGMQFIALQAGGSIEQHLPDVNGEIAQRHWGRRVHEVEGDIGAGVVLSHHRQAITDPGSLRVCASAPDGIIEAVRDDDRPFYLGVQWHPERTEDEALGISIFRGLIEAARKRG